MEHEEFCPWVSSRKEQNSLALKMPDKPCEIRKCAVWRDLKTWFGYKGRSLSRLAFEGIFRDVAHGGSGVYERMAVEGGNLLKMVTQAQALKKSDGNLFVNGVSKLLFKDMEIEHSLKLVKSLYIQKESQLMNDISLLDHFARSYMSAAQNLTSPRAAANYIKVCLSFSLNEICGSHQHKPSAEWLPALLQHINHCQKFTHLSCDSDNLLLKYLHVFMGYKHEYLLPRIKECFNDIRNAPQATEIPGETLLTTFAMDYFSELYKTHHGDLPALALEYAKSETKAFFSSRAVELFACLYMQLHLISINRTIDMCYQRSSGEAALIFKHLLGACWSISQKSERNVWMANIFQTIRQIQLAIMLHFSGSPKDLSHLDYEDIKNADILENKFDLLLNSAKPREGKRRNQEPRSLLKTALDLIGGGCMPSTGEVEESKPLAEGIDNATKCQNPISKSCVRVVPPSRERDGVLPINVKFVTEKDSKGQNSHETAHIRVPLNDLNGSESINYRTTLKKQDKDVMELVLSGGHSQTPMMNINFSPP